MKKCKFCWNFFSALIKSVGICCGFYAAICILNSYTPKVDNKNKDIANKLKNDILNRSNKLTNS